MPVQKSTGLNAKAKVIFQVSTITFFVFADGGDKMIKGSGGDDRLDCRRRPQSDDQLCAMDEPEISSKEGHRIPTESPQQTEKAAEYYGEKLVAEFPSLCIEVVGHSVHESRLHQDGILISQTSKEVYLLTLY